MEKYTEKEIISKAQSLIPELKDENVKGQMGIIGVVGGSEEYTGAPYFSGLGALRTGADLCHIICSPKAAIPIKACYSPELIVHSLMVSESDTRGLSHKESSNLIDTRTRQIETIISRINALVVGPGLSRDPIMQDIALRIVVYAKTRGIHIVIDGDGLMLVQNTPNVFKDYDKLVLSPNINEYKRLNFSIGTGNRWNILTDNSQVIEVSTLKSFRKAIIVSKGKIDVIIGPRGFVKVTCPSHNRRCGGQGDLVSGAIATFLAWKSLSYPDTSTDDASESSLLITAACYGALLLVKQASLRTFKSLGRSMVAGDIINNIGKTFDTLFNHSGR